MIQAATPAASTRTSTQDPSSEAIASAMPTRPATRAQLGIQQPKVCTDGTIGSDKHTFLTTTGEPTSVDKTLVAKNWKKAMNLEFDALVKMKLGTIVLPYERQKYC
jgi:hypothetical protein